MGYDDAKKLTCFIVISKGVPEIHEVKFPDFFLNKFMASIAKLQRDIEIFNEIKQISLPSKKDIDRFWKVLYQIDDDFDSIDTYEGFVEAIRKNNSFVDFCLDQNDSFKIKLLEYLSV